MAKKSFRQTINDMSAYSQINKAFRHVHGVPAASVLATLLYKYDYWKEEKSLEKINTKSGEQQECFFISKMDISIDSGVSISALEKRSGNPIKLLQSLGVIKVYKNTVSNKADRFVIVEDVLIYEINKANTIFKEDMDLHKKLPRQQKRSFLKALKGKKKRFDIFNEFECYIEYEELDSDEMYSDEKVLDNLKEEPFKEDNEVSSNVEENSSNEGRTKNNTKNTTKNSPKNIKENHEPNTKPEFLNQDSEFEKKAEEEGITSEGLKIIIKNYVEGNVKELYVHTALRFYLPDGLGKRWMMSPEDKEYIRVNLKTDDLGYLDASLEYIDTNIQRMVSGEREMRFGSVLAGIREKVIEAGRGFVDQRPPKTKEEYKTMLAEMPDRESFDFEDDL